MLEYAKSISYECDGELFLLRHTARCVVNSAPVDFFMSPASSMIQGMCLVENCLFGQWGHRFFLFSPIVPPENSLDFPWRYNFDQWAAPWRTFCSSGGPQTLELLLYFQGNPTVLTLLRLLVKVNDSHFNAVGEG